MFGIDVRPSYRMKTYDGRTLPIPFGTVTLDKPDVIPTTFCKPTQLMMFMFGIDVRPSFSHEDV